LNPNIRRIWPVSSAVALDQAQIAFLAKLLGIRGLGANEAEARHAAALLVDGDERLDVREVAKVVDELAQLFGGVDITAEENKSPRLEFFEAIGGFDVQFRSGHAREEKLAEVVHGGWEEVESGKVKRKSFDREMMVLYSASNQRSHMGTRICFRC
jgi:hypothetical protein